MSSLGGGSPSCDLTFSSCLILLHLLREGDWSNIVIREVSFLLQMQETDVVIDCPAVVVFMENHLFDGNIFLRSFLVLPVIFSYSDSKSMCTHTEARVRTAAMRIAALIVMESPC